MTEFDSYPGAVDAAQDGIPDRTQVPYAAQVSWQPTQNAGQHGYVPNQYMLAPWQGSPAATPVSPLPAGGRHQASTRKTRVLLFVTVTGIVVATAAIVAMILIASRTLPVGDSVPAPAIDENDQPLGTWEQIANPEMTSEDARVLTVLQPSLEAASADAPAPSQAYDAVMRISPSEAVGVASTRSLSWDEVGEGWDALGEGDLCPQLWTRIARLSADWASQKVGGEWEVVDFSYPVDGADKNAVTRIVGMSDDNVGMTLDIECPKGEKGQDVEFHCDDEVIDRALRNHEFARNTMGTLDQIAEEHHHAMALQGTANPVAVVNIRYDYDESETDYEMLVDDAFRPLCEEIGQVMGRAGCESAEIYVLSWESDKVEDLFEITLADPMQWKYAFHEAPSIRYSRLPYEAKRHYLASGAFVLAASEISHLRGDAAWSHDGGVVLGEKSRETTDSVRSIGDPDPDPREAFAECDFAIRGLPDQIGDSMSGPLYGWWNAPYDDERGNSLRILYAAGEREPDWVFRYGAVAEIVKEPLEEGDPAIDYEAPEEGNVHHLELSDGRIAFVETLPEDEREQGKWIQRIFWRRQSEEAAPGTWGYVYRLELYGKSVESDDESQVETRSGEFDDDEIRTIIDDII